MQTQQALRRIQTKRPTSPKEFRDLGLLGRYLGCGAFRQSFRIRGTSLIVKFPLNESTGHKPVYKSGIGHSRTEMRRYKKLHHVKALRPHLPKVWYYDAKHGVIVMTHYAKLGGYGGWTRIGLMGNVIRKLILQICRTAMNDINGDNIRMAGGKYNKRLIFVDLGY